MKKNGDTMTGNLAISGYLYPSLYLLPTYNSTSNRTVFEGSYVGASSLSSWEDGTGKSLDSPMPFAPLSDIFLRI